jgi:hypothetical protein
VGIIQKKIFAKYCRYEDLDEICIGHEPVSRYGNRCLCGPRFYFCPSAASGSVLLVSGYFRKFFAIKEAEARAERFAKGKILKSAHFRSQSDLNKNSDRTGYFGKLS